MRKNTSSAQSIKIAIIRHLRQWHRHLGIITAFFLILLSITGIGLNHTERLALSHHPINNEWLLDHYGIKAPTDIRYYQNKQASITHNHVWLGEKLLLESNEPVVSLAKFQTLWLVVSRSQLSLYNDQGDLVDQLNNSLGLPNNIKGLSVTSNHIILNTQTGYYQSDENLLEWRPINTFIEPKWLLPEKASLQEIDQATLRYRSQFLTLERVILDTHSGRIFGDVGVIFMDLIAISLILLSISGIYIWVRYARSKR
jgi:hypothetical protein